MQTSNTTILCSDPNNTAGPTDVERTDVHVLWSDRLARGDIGWKPATPTVTTPLVTRLTAAALPFIPATHCFELSNNIACASPDCTEIEAHIAIMIRHRLANQWIQCSDVDMCAVVMGRAWRRWHAEQGAEVAA